jgi:biopolymer transport protein ExbD
MMSIRRKKHRLHNRTDAELNLIPLIDILSVLVAFLLVYSADVEVVQNSKGVEVPLSTAEVLPKQSVLVMITRDQLFVQGELVADIADIRDPQRPLVDSLRAVLERPMLDDPALAQSGPIRREITVLADKSLPYDVVKKVMATCTAAEYSRISLAVLQKETPVPLGASNRA